MNVQAVARAFAKALVESAMDAGEIDTVSEDIHSLQDEYGATPSLRAYCSGRHASDPATREGAVLRLWEGRVSPLTLLALRQMALWDALPVLPHFLKAFDTCRNRAAGIHVARATFAVAPSESELEGLRTLIGKHFSGDKVEIRSEVQPDLLAGFRVDVDDVSIDASLSGRLHRTFGL